MQDRDRLQVELYAHGGWWKDSNGRSGQVAEAVAKKGPLATVAALSNSFGADGWRLTDFASAQHNSYWLSFELAPDAPAPDAPLADDDAADASARRAAMHLG